MLNGRLGAVLLFEMVMKPYKDNKTHVNLWVKII